MAMTSMPVLTIMIAIIMSMAMTMRTIVAAEVMTRSRVGAIGYARSVRTVVAQPPLITTLVLHVEVHTGLEVAAALRGQVGNCFI